MITNEALIGSARRDAVAACLRAGATREQAEDATQQALLEAVRSTRHLDQDRPLSGWLQTTAYRRYLDHQRATRRESSIGLDSHHWHTHDRTVAPIEEALLSAAHAHQGIAAVADLPAQTQHVVELTAAGQSVGQIALALTVTPASVSNSLYRARQHIRRSLVLPAIGLAATLTSAILRSLRRATPGVVTALPALVLVLAIHDTTPPTPTLDDAAPVPQHSTLTSPPEQTRDVERTHPATQARPPAPRAASLHVPAARPTALPSPQSSTVADAGVVIITAEPVDGPTTPAEVLMYCLEHLSTDPYIGC